MHSDVDIKTERNSHRQKQNKCSRLNVYLFRMFTGRNNTTERLNYNRPKLGAKMEGLIGAAIDIGFKKNHTILR